MAKRETTLSFEENKGETGNAFERPAIGLLEAGEQFIGISGIRLSAVLTRELFCRSLAVSVDSPEAAVQAAALKRFAGLASHIAHSAAPMELALVMASEPSAPLTSQRVQLGLLALSRAATKEDAFRYAWQAAGQVASVASVNLGFARVDTIHDFAQLAAFGRWLNASHMVEVCRRSDNLELGHGAVVQRQVGFTGGASASNAAVPTLTHLYPWAPAVDSWHTLVETLAHEPAPSALVVHVKGVSCPDDRAVSEARNRLAAAEKLTQQATARGVDTVLASQASVLRNFALSRLSVVQNRCLAARIFIAGCGAPSSALTAAMLSALDPSPEGDGAGVEMIFRGGATTRPALPRAALEALDEGSIEQLYSPLEATAFLRTPLPAVNELFGFASQQCRTAAITGVSGNDTVLGINAHRGISKRVALDLESRFRHTYVVGQTGTGKSTLLLQMALHDIRAGRSVIVIDPHGSLYQDILLRYPAQRAADLVLLDLTDDSRPVGFNVLCIDELDPARYRDTRDMIIEDMYAYMQATYLREHMGPIFETHLRGVLALLMGQKRPPRHLIPNLMLFRLVYNSSGLRRKLAQRCQNDDFTLADFVKEADAAGGEASIANMAPYVTSKFTRFIADARLRNITCQSRMLDIASIVNQGKVLLVNLGKGCFGDQAAGLVASQLMTRVRSAILQRGVEGVKQPVFLYADEFHLFADDRMSEMLAEARKFGLALTLAHQHTAQLPEKVLTAVLGNVGTSILFRIGASDAKNFEGMLFPNFGATDLVSLPNYNAVVKPSGTLGERSFTVKTLAPSADTDPSLAQGLRLQSAMVHGIPRKQAEAEVHSTYLRYQRGELSEEVEASEGETGAGATDAA